MAATASRQDSNPQIRALFDGVNRGSCVLREAATAATAAVRVEAEVTHDEFTKLFYRPWLESCPARLSAASWHNVLKVVPLTCRYRCWTRRSRGYFIRSSAKRADAEKAWKTVEFPDRSQAFPFLDVGPRTWTSLLHEATQTDQAAHRTSKSRSTTWQLLQIFGL